EPQEPEHPAHHQRPATLDGPRCDQPQDQDTGAGPAGSRGNPVRSRLLPESGLLSVAVIDHHRDVSLGARLLDDRSEAWGGCA
ncbi:MAG: Sulfatase, partial [uncultured Thermomicrobiales bacterium]